MYRFKAEVWRHDSSGGWFFVTVPGSVSEEIRLLFGELEEGWGRLKASATIGGSNWESAIWYDTKLESYLLPLKAEIRKKEDLVTGKIITVQLKI
ncbi:MAG: DUF1905 domain-containing protein [Crocinitomicaceae bacterium]